MTTVALRSVSGSAISRPRPGRAAQIVPLLVSDVIAVFLAGTIAVLTRYYLGGVFELALYFRMSSVIGVFIAAYAAISFGFWVNSSNARIASTIFSSKRPAWLIRAP